MRHTANPGEVKASYLPTNLPSVARAKLPAVYSNAKDALAKCERIDECKDWADKAEALASYAKQAQDDELRKTADRIQARAIRRCGQLLGEIEASSGGRTPAGTGIGSPRNEAAKSAGLSDRQKHTALRVARVPGDEFEEAVESDDPPTVTALAERGKLPAPTYDLKGRKPEDFKAATQARGWIREVNGFCTDHTARSVAAGFMPHELERRAEVISQARYIAKWIEEFVAALRKEKA